MNSLDFTSTNSLTNWLIFLGVLLVIGLGFGIFVLWSKGLRGMREPHHKKHRKHRRRHNQQHNPTLAERDGLPPKRPDGLPPLGP